MNLPGQRVNSGSLLVPNDKRITAKTSISSCTPIIQYQLLLTPDTKYGGSNINTFLDIQNNFYDFVGLS
jgi:hypothetical protein